MQHVRVPQSLPPPTLVARVGLRTAILIAVFLIAACQAGTGGVAPSGSPAMSPSVAPASPSATPPASPGPSAVPSAPAASPSPSTSLTIADGAMVRTLSSGFEVRPRHDRSAEPIDAGGPMAAGTLLYVAAGPVAAAGSDWFFFMPFDVGPAGWATASDATGTSLVVKETDRCPESPLDVQELLDLGSFGGLACFGRTEIRLVGDLTCQDADVDRPFAGPDWLAFDHRCTIALGGGQEFEIHDRGPVSVQPTIRGARVVGHFDDAQATTCAWGLDPPAPDPIAVVTNCRAMFVATTIIVGP